VTVSIIALTLVIGCAEGPESATDAAANGNVLVAEWTGPYGGVPAFDRMDLADLKPALEAGMERNLAEIDEITANPDPPTFENTIVAMERTGRDLDRALTYRGIWSSNLSSPEFREIQLEMAPKLAEFNTKIIQNQALFDRIRSVYESDDAKTLRPDQQRLLQLVYDRFARNGATLTGEKKQRYAEINQRLAELHTRFANNVLADEEGYVTYLTEDQLGGLPESFVRAAAAAAAERGRDGEYAVTNTRSSMDPFLTFSDERDLREQVWRTYYSRGDNADEHDNNAVIPEILQLRHERVRLLGYENYAAWRLENRMAKTPDRVFELLEAVWPAALARVEEEVAGCRHAGDRRRRGRRDHDRALGLPLLRREGPQGEVRSRLRRGEAVPATRESHRGDALRCGRAVHLRLHAGARG
jgi:peptidyl-dipeptidase Dcp